MDQSLLTQKENDELTRVGQVFQHRPPLPVPSDSRSRFVQRCERFQFGLLPGYQDEDVFSVLSRSIFRSEYAHQEMRTCVVYQMEHYRNWYAPYFEGLPEFEDYCMSVRNGRAADALSVMAACDLFRVKYRELMDDRYLVMAEVSPSPSLSSFSRKIIWSSHSDFTGIRPLARPADNSLNADDDAYVFKLRLLRQYLDNSPVNAAAAVVNICHDLLSHLPQNQVEENEYRRHDQRIVEWGFVRIPMAGDGNCMFRTMAYLIFHDQDDHFAVRLMIVSKMKAQRARYEHLCFFKDHETERRLETFDEYLQRMAISEEWGDDACIQAASDMSYMKINVLEAHRTRVWVEYVPQGIRYFKEGYCCRNSHHMDALERCC